MERWLAGAVAGAMAVLLVLSFARRDWFERFNLWPYPPNSKRGRASTFILYWVAGILGAWTASTLTSTTYDLGLSSVAIAIGVGLGMLIGSTLKRPPAPSVHDRDDS